MPKETAPSLPSVASDNSLIDLYISSGLSSFY